MLTVIRLMILALFLVLWAASAFAANLFVEGGAGMTHFLKTSDDGVWIQDRLPHTTDWQDVAIRAGAGVRLNPSWSIGVNYLRLGQVTLDSVWQRDEEYSAHCHHDCGDFSGHLWTRMQGGEVIGTYQPVQWAVSPIFRAGLAIMHHSVNWTMSHRPQDVGQSTGLIAMGVLGAGACYHDWVCGDVSYYRGFIDTGFPLSTSAVVSVVTLKYTFD